MLELESLIDKPEDVMEGLPKDQKIIIEDLLEQGKTNDEAAEIWLSATSSLAVQHIKREISETDSIEVGSDETTDIGEEETREFYDHVDYQATEFFEEEIIEPGRVLDEIKKEVRDFICNEGKYEDERNQFRILLKEGIESAIKFLAALISVPVKIPIVTLIVVVTLLLNTALKMGTNIWCSLQMEPKDSPAEV